ncbi:relaxase/mobilization nuclease domain-containing protein [Spirosoma sp. BT702]|uniref:Relaxase/mobilization nuclease domain-containing protein n=1 Tax=Spirosoma profusum TaxID=2771354 RepID=A0A926Y4L6_9BACT|nr:relaxase/mobilization nuclease domain-containing protein [Spirosoma profusum]MBD2703370.1 relaxase/mobilization nuclease domain-containing protein [Spirosoma profusum]
MVIRISSGSSPTGAGYYNETKVGKGDAERLAVRNYRGVILPVQELGLATVTAKLEQQADLNPKIRKPTFHASLSMAKGEKPSAIDMIAIADRYMEGLGYGKQPYVIYQHFDTDHPHLHIVSVRVDSVGKKISDTYERERSNKLRQQIEKEFGLQVAQKAALRPERGQLQPVEYGRGDLKQDIATVVNGILQDFTFSSFSQFNQLLNLYNVRATEVALEGKKPGLVYSAIDSNKAAQGATFKASGLPRQPTMETVSRRMNAGKKVKGDKVARLRKVAFNQLAQSTGWDNFQQRLSGVGVEVIPHFGTGNNLFGLSFVDVRSRAIYTGSELGKSFTAGSLKAALGETYIAPSKRELAPEPTTKLTNKTEETDFTNKQTHLTQNQEPMPNLDLISQLLYAIGRDGDEQESEHELKKMLKRAHKARLS